MNYDNEMTDKNCKLKEIQEKIIVSHENFKANCDRFHEFTSFVCNTTLTNSARNALKALNKPELEFNILEQEISNQRGEFFMHEPSVFVSVADGTPIEMITQELVAKVEIVEGYMRKAMSKTLNDDTAYKTITDTFIGGFSSWRIIPEYVNDMSFEYKINIEKCDYPTMVGYDPMARDSHKGDGQYCYELVPMRRKEFECMFGNKRTEKMKFSRQQGQFSWSYKSQKEEIILLAYFYEKQEKKMKIVQLSNNEIMTKKQYKKFLQRWEELGIIEQPPAIKKERMSKRTVIRRYLVCESEIIEEEETDFKYLPFVFVDGNSINLMNEQSNEFEQMTRPLVYHAKSAQQLTDFAYQSKAYEIQNIVQGKWLVPLETIAEDYQDCWKNPQENQVYVFNSTLDGDPEKQLPLPREINRTITPPIISETCDKMPTMTQVILGTHNAQLSQQGARMSGESIKQSRLSGSSVAKPYLISYTHALNQAAKIILDLIPKYFLEPRMFEIMDKKGRESRVMLNAEQNYRMDYNPEFLSISVEAAPSTSTQKQMSIEQMTGIMKASPQIAQFMGTDGAEFFFDNMEVRGIDKTKLQFEEWKKNMAQMQASQPKPLDPVTASLQIEQMKAQQKAQSDAQKNELEMQQMQIDAKVKAAEIAIEKQNADTKYIEAISKISLSEAELAMEAEKVDAQLARTEVMEMAEIHKINHSIRMDHHKVRLEEGVNERKKEMREKDLKVPVINDQ